MLRGDTALVVETCKSMPMVWAVETVDLLAQIDVAFAEYPDWFERLVAAVDSPQIAHPKTY